MATNIRLPDGSTIAIATDDPKQAAAAARKVWANQQAQKTTKAEAPKRLTAKQTTAGNFVGRAFDAFTMGLGDEVQGIGSAIDETTGAIGKAIRSGDASKAWKEYHPGEAFAQGSKEFKQDQQGFSRDHSSLAAAATTAGVVGSIVVPVGRVVGGAGRAIQAVPGGLKAGRALVRASQLGKLEKGANLADRFKSGAKIGAAYGAASGVASGDEQGQGGLEGIADRVVGGVKGAGLGLLAGGAIPLVGQAGRAVGRYAGDTFTAAGRKAAGERMAHMDIADDITNAGATPQQAAQEHAHRNEQLGVPTWLGDLYDTTRSRLVSEATKLGPARAAVREAAGARADSQSNRVIGHIERDLGKTVEPKAHAQVLSDSRGAASGQAYARAFGETPVLTERAVKTLEANPFMRSAIKQGEKIVGDADTSLQPMSKKVSQPGQKWFPEQPANPGEQVPSGLLDASGKPIMKTVGATEAIPAGMRKASVPKMSVVSAANAHLNRVGQYGKSFQATPGQQGAVNAARMQGKALRDVFGNKAWGEARDVHRRNTRLMEAFDTGLNNHKATGDELRALKKGMNAQEEDQLVKGIQAKLVEDVKGADFYGDTTKKLIGNLRKNDTLAEAFGNAKGGKNLKRLASTLDAERSTSLTYKRLEGVPHAMDRGVTDADAGGAIAQAGALAATGGFGAMANRVLKFATTALTIPQRRAYRAKLAEAYASADPKRVKKILSDIGVEQKNQAALLEGINRRAPRYSKAAGASYAQLPGETIDEQ